MIATEGGLQPENIRNLTSRAAQQFSTVSRSPSQMVMITNSMFVYG